MKISMNQRIRIAGVVVTLVVGLATIYFSQPTTKYAPQSAGTVSGNVTQVQGDGNTFVTNENKQIPYPRVFKTSISYLRTVAKTMLNVKYFLPNDKEAFIPRLDSGKEYILFYTNDDMSDISVPEKYRYTSELDSKVCWGVTINCSNLRCESSELQASPHVQSRERTCFAY